MKIRIFRVPADMTAEILAAILPNVTNVKLEIDHFTKRPRGTATAEIAEESILSQINSTTYQGVTFGAWLCH